jgi:hypothetical protein
MKLKYKFICKDLGIEGCNDYVTYGNRKKDIVERVKKHLIKSCDMGNKEANSKEVIKKIKSSIRKSKYVLEEDE